MPNSRFIPRKPPPDHIPGAKHSYYPAKGRSLLRCRICGLPSWNRIHLGRVDHVSTGEPPVPGEPPIRRGNSAGQANRFTYAIVKPAPLPGSTLQSLSQTYYRNTNEWSRIYEANRKGKRRADGTPGLIENPNRLGVGWKLIIPR